MNIDTDEYSKSYILTAYDMINYAKSFIGTEYLYGANGGGAFDCSGFVLECLRAFDIYTGPDITANGLYQGLSKMNWRSQLDTGSILFFGRDRKNITHVAIAIDLNFMIEAGGGDSSTVTNMEAIKRGAMVRIRPIKNRGDLQAVLKPVDKNYKGV